MPVKHYTQTKLESGTNFPEIRGKRRTNATVPASFGTNCSVTLTLQTPLSVGKVPGHQQPKSQLSGHSEGFTCLPLQAVWASRIHDAARDAGCFCFLSFLTFIFMPVLSWLPPRGSPPIPGLGFTFKMGSSPQR